MRVAFFAEEPRRGAADLFDKQEIPDSLHLADVIASQSHMSPDEALSVLNDYNIASPDTYKAQFGPRKAATGTYASLHKNELRPAVNGDIAKFRQLITFLDTDTATRGDVLMALISVFDLKVYMLAGNSAFLNDVPLRSKLLELKRTTLQVTWTQIQAFSDLRTKKGGPKNALDAAADVTKIFYGQTVTDVMDVLNAVVSDEGNAAMVSSATIEHLIQVYKGCPAKKFPGFTAWGPGDSRADGETNRKNHFVKHVLGQAGMDVQEAPWWWRALQINVRKSDLTEPVSVPGDNCFRIDGTLNPAKLADFISTAVRNRADLRDTIYNAYKDHYSEYAFRLSKELSNTMVEATPGLVGVSGFTGHVFLFGRYDGPGTDLGLSSCYFVFPANRSEKLDPKKVPMMWKLK